MRILLTDPDYKHTLAAGRYLSRAGHEVFVVGGKGTISGRSRHLHPIGGSNYPFDEEGIRGLAAALEEHAIDVLIPIGALSVRGVSGAAKELGARTALAMPSPESLAVALSKTETIAAAASAGVPVPRSVEPSLAPGWREEIAGWEVEGLIIKGNSEFEKGAVVYCDSAEDVFRWADSNPDPLERVVVQQRVVGFGCGYFAVADHGEVLTEFMHRRIRETPPSGGASSCCESYWDEDVALAGRRLLEELRWHGPAMVEFKREGEEGTAYLMEINPKFWGSLELALWCGVNFPQEVALLASGEGRRREREFKVGKRFHWLVPDLIHLSKKPSSIWAVARDCLSPSVGGNFWITDPLPNLVEIGRLVRNGFLRLIRLRK